MQIPIEVDDGKVTRASAETARRIVAAIDFAQAYAARLRACAPDINARAASLYEINRAMSADTIELACLHEKATRLGEDDDARRAQLRASIRLATHRMARKSCERIASPAFLRQQRRAWAKAAEKSVRLMISKLESSRAEGSAQ